MKKIVFSLLMLLGMPLMTQAATVDVPSADMSFTLANDWYVFTRDNLEGNTDLENLEITVEDMQDYLLEYDLYVDAFTEDYDFFVYKTATEKVGSLPDYYDFELEEFATSIMNTYGADSYEIYDNDYKYIRIEYFESDYYVIDYFTIIDNQYYILSIQKLDEEFSDSERKMMQDIVDSVQFDNYEPEDNKELIIVAIGIGLVVVLGVTALIVSRVKDKKESKEKIQVSRFFSFEIIILQ